MGHIKAQQPKAPVPIALEATLQTCWVAAPAHSAVRGCRPRLKELQAQLYVRNCVKRACIRWMEWRSQAVSTAQQAPLPFSSVQLHVTIAHQASSAHKAAKPVLCAPTVPTQHTPRPNAKCVNSAHLPCKVHPPVHHVLLGPLLTQKELESVHCALRAHIKKLRVRACALRVLEDHIHRFWAPGIRAQSALQERPAMLWARRSALLALQVIFQAATLQLALNVSQATILMKLKV